MPSLFVARQRKPLLVAAGPFLLILALLALWAGTSSVGALPAPPSQNGPIALVSVSTDGLQGNAHSGFPSISADGRYVAFHSETSNLVAGDSNGVVDVLVHDRRTGQTTRVSVDSSGAQGNGNSGHPVSISADGRYVAFESDANNLVAGDTNGTSDIFVHDRGTRRTTRVSVNSSGDEGNDVSLGASISADGRFVAFYSGANNLVTGDTNGRQDVFVHDRQKGLTNRVSVDSSGAQGNSLSARPSISADGRYVAFISSAMNLVAGDTNGRDDVFVYDRQTGRTTRISVDSSGAEGNDVSFNASINADGRYVAFVSGATNLVTGDTNGRRDVFVYDRQTGQTTRVSVDSTGAEGNFLSRHPSISADGRYVAFFSFANNLVAGDSNGVVDVFVHDRRTGRTVRVSVDSTGAESDEGSAAPSVSADGRYLAFLSCATNLVAGDTNGEEDVFATLNPLSAGALCNGLTPTIYGTPAADLLVGTSSTGGDVILALGGNDVIRGLETRTETPC